MLWRARCLWLMALVLGLSRLAGAMDFHVIPYDVDPPITIDGKLDDWAEVPNPILLNKPEQVTYGKDMWTGPDDLSGVIRLAYRAGGLFIAAEITDDTVNMPYRARDIWKGDHINLWMDTSPAQDPNRKMFGRGQFHVVFNPGTLGGVNGKGEVTDPEIYVYRPEGLPQEGGQIVSRRTEKGYIIEAFLPWERVGIPAARMNQDVNFEVAISEADGDPARQETLMTYGTEKWVYSRTRLCVAVFGDGNGKGRPPLRAIPVAEKLELPATQRQTITFDVAELPADKEPAIFFKSRLVASSVTGVRDRSLAVELNGKRIDGARISNRRPESRFFMGNMQTFVWPDGAVALYYANGYDRPAHSPKYALMDTAPNCEYEFNVDGLIKTGSNTLAFISLVPETEKGATTAEVRDVEMRIKVKLPPPPPLKPAPTGKLPVVEPQSKFTRTWSGLRSRKNTLAFKVNGEQAVVTSRFSAPDGKWYTGSSPYYKHKRKVLRGDEYLEVRDTFVNTSAENVPIMQEHTCALGEGMKKSLAGGLPAAGRQRTQGRLAEPQRLRRHGEGGAGLLRAQRRLHRACGNDSQGRRAHPGRPQLRAEEGRRIHGRLPADPRAEARFLGLHQPGPPRPRRELPAQVVLRLHVASLARL